MQRQKARVERAYNALLKLADVDTDSVAASQEAWKKYRQATCDLVGYWYRWPADMGKHQNTCEWRMTRLRANELEILVKDASAELLPKSEKQPSKVEQPIRLPPNRFPPR